MKSFGTEQESFWAGNFGDEYSRRNASSQIIAGNLHLFSRIFDKIEGIASVLEFGANIGMNLQAIKLLLPSAALSAVEINNTAADELRKIESLQVYHQSILSFNAETTYDLVFTKGVLIHINPDRLKDVYNKLYNSSRKYIVIAEYYNPTPVEIGYRGHAGKLFKRDFAGEFMAAYSDVTMIDYGFSYHGDSTFPQDDITWFLLKKDN